MSLASDLAELRRRHGITLAEWARRAGVSESYIGELTNGTRGTRARLPVLEQLAAAVGESPAVFQLYRHTVACAEHPESVDAVFYAHHPEAA